MKVLTMGGDAMLDYQVKCYYHAPYLGMRHPENTIPFVNVLKNDFCTRRAHEIAESESALRDVLRNDFARIVALHGPLTVCGIPRSKAETAYSQSQMGLKRAIRSVVREFPELWDGMDFIVRHSNTRTTHLNRSGYGGEGCLPYRGITRDTCWMSSEIFGRNILLVDDIYTPGVGIDEDAVQALFDAGAANVVFYAVGKARGNTGYASRFCD